VGRFNDDLFAEPLARQYNLEDRQVLELGGSLVKENRFSKNKDTKWLHVVKVAVLQNHDRVGGLVCSGRDITQLKKVQEQLTHAQKMESVGRLAAGVAHEINTPLGIILGYAQILLEDIVPQGQAYKDVATIVKQTRICSKIVADLLSFSRSSQRIITTFDMNGAIEEVLDVVEHTFGLSHVTVERIYDQPQLWLKGDKEKLKQACVNLLNNAFDAIEENGTIQIKTGLAVTKKEVKIIISDTGHGIAQADMKKLFEPFYTTKGPGKGTGLGLSVTFGIIKEHNGTIEVFSPPLPEEKLERGTSVVVTLPAG
jgi:signal transduction histidine kinase